MAKSYYEYLSEVLKNQESAMKNEKNVAENKYLNEKNSAKKVYGDKIRSVDSSYSQEIDKENINRLIEERKIKEAMSNLGLNASGLNSKNNRDFSNKIKIEKLQKDNASERNSISADRDNELLKIDDKKNQEFQKIDNNYKKSAENTAETLYKEDLKAEQKAQEEARKLEEARIKAETERIKAEQKVEAERIKAEAKVRAAQAKKSSGTKKPEKKEETEETEEVKIDAEPEFNYVESDFVKLSPEQLENVSKVIPNIILLSPQEYANERRLNKVLPKYSVYVDDVLLRLKRDKVIDKDEYEYLKHYYNVQ